MAVLGHEPRSVRKPLGPQGRERCHFLADAEARRTVRCSPGGQVVGNGATNASRSDRRTDGPASAFRWFGFILISSQRERFAG